MESVHIELPIGLRRALNGANLRATNDEVLKAVEEGNAYRYKRLESARKNEQGLLKKLFSPDMRAAMDRKPHIEKMPLVDGQGYVAVGSSEVYPDDLHGHVVRS